MPEQRPEISVVVPVFNEEKSLEPLLERLAATMEALGRPFEVITVDDGSSDGSAAVLTGLRDRYPWLRIVRLVRNFGQNPAMFAGLAHVRGDYVVMIDADLQNPPEDIPKLVAKLEEGFDVANGWRKQRQDSPLRIVPSRVMNFLMSRLTGVHLHDYGCALKAMRREVADQLSIMQHRSRYVPVEIVSLGVRIAEVEVSHCARESGQSKYNFRVLVRTSFDLLTSITTAPLRVIGLVGWLFAALGFLMAAGVVVYFLLGGDYSPTTIMLAALFLLSGVQMIATGFMCEYISRIFIEVRRKPYYVVKDVIE